MGHKYDVVVIGAGVVGLATALELTRRFPSHRILVLDKETSVAAHQTGHNSGVIHSGLYYKPGSMKARLAVSGAEAMIAFCREHAIPHQICGKVVVATEESELPGLEELYRRGVANGVPGLRMLDAAALREIEPHATGIRAIHVPSAGITDYRLVSEKYAELIVAAGGEVRLGTRVDALERADGITILRSRDQEFHARYVINCAGLQGDRISHMAGAKLDLQIVPFRGEYYEIVPEKRHLCRGLIYPVPDPRFPFLGVHFTLHVNGAVEAGPNAVLAFAREGYSKTSFDLADTVEMATYPGLWKLVFKYWAAGAEEYYRSLVKPAFVRALQKLLPELRSEDVHPGGAGVRAMPLYTDGRLADDFAFVESDRMMHVCSVPSPAATTSLLIGRAIVDRVEPSIAPAVAVSTNSR
jgi:(S)-2-hydroxyglutarate dehydrogenase